MGLGGIGLAIASRASGMRIVAIDPVLKGSLEYVRTFDQPYSNFRRSRLVQQLELEDVCYFTCCLQLDKNLKVYSDTCLITPQDDIVKFTLIDSY